MTNPNKSAIKLIIIIIGLKTNIQSDCRSLNPCLSSIWASLKLSSEARGIKINIIVKIVTVIITITPIVLKNIRTFH
jgi:hypothetical protein